MYTSILKSILAFAGLGATLACDDHASHAHTRRTVPVRPPTRELEWGDINFIHTTDTHGWYLGHQKSSAPEPNYSGDMGEFLSFAQRMKEKALKKDVDLLVIDSGDLHSGTGLVDGSPSNSVLGHDALQLLKRVPYDVMAIGNHELYNYSITLDMHQQFAPSLKGRFLSSNVNITVNQGGRASSVPVGSRFAKFRTRKGRRITALGVLFNFMSNDKNTTVQRPADMVKESWFLDAIKEEPDVFLLVGHMPIQAGNDWPLVFNAIRAVHPKTPIIILGGHSHIRDCNRLDGRSVSFQSGRYMETVGWLSVNLKPKCNITVGRRYLDANRATYEFHTGKSGRQLDTKEGTALTRDYEGLANKYNLGFKYGTAPRDLTLNRSPFPSNTSSPSVLGSQAVPYAISVNKTRANIPNLVIVQAGSQRYDIFAGAFTRNDELTASPFQNAFMYIQDVRLGDAKRVLSLLNGGSLSGVPNTTGSVRRALGRGEERQKAIEEMVHGGPEYNHWVQAMSRASDEEEMERRVAGGLTPGYVTQDSCPGIGDDTPHVPIGPFFHVPTYVSSNPPSGTDDTRIDLVFVDFIQEDVIEGLNAIQSERVFVLGDVRGYTTVLLRDVWGVYAGFAWV